jgi:Uncharacterised nucleotidyltransferase
MTATPTSTGSARNRAPASAWPTAAQGLLLRAALLPSGAALEAWQQWKVTHDLVGSALDPDSSGLLPLVSRNLGTVAADDPDMPRLKGVYRYWWCANHQMLSPIAAVLERLRENGIRTLILGAIATAGQFYRSSGERPLERLDVLVAPDQARAAVESLAQDGWRAHTGRLGEALRYRPGTRMIREGCQEIGLRWRALRGSFDADVDRGFWRRSLPLTIHGAASRGLASCDALLHAVVEAMHSGSPPSIWWIADATAILNTAADRLDWRTLLDEARARDVQQHVVTGLDYLRDGFDAPIPGDALARLRAGAPSRIERLELRPGPAESGPSRHSRAVSAATRITADYLRLVSGRSLFGKLAEIPPFLSYRLRDRPAWALGRARRPPGRAGHARPASSRATRLG